jgi:demethylspheroidene O-methyltransferase
MPTVARVSRWLDRWRDLRDRMVISATFRERAAAFPLTRPIARRRARELFDLVGGFVYSQVLLACVRLGLFELLAAGPQTLDGLAPRLGLAPEAAERLLAAAVALRLVAHRSHGRYALGPLGAPLVGNAGLTAMIEHHALLYGDLADPVALLRGEQGHTALSEYWSYARAGQPAAAAPERVAGYTALMAASQSLVASEILDAYPLAQHRCLLDVGGGDGGFLIAAARRAPALQLKLFDLPAVAARGRLRLEAEGLAARSEVSGGDFRIDPLPMGADVISLVRVVHDHDDPVVLELLRAAHKALPPAGTLLLGEPMAGTPGAERMGDAYFGMYLLAMGSGRPRSLAALERLLRTAGFRHVRPVDTHMPLQTRLIVARA